MLSSCTSIEIRRHEKTNPWTYEALNQRQREIQNGILNGNPGVLLLSELAPVITHGRRTPKADLLNTAPAQTQIYATDRGGLATYHGPGQWVLFPVESMVRLTGDRRGVRKVIEGLLDVALQVGLLYNPTCHVRMGAEMGVWTSQGKFAAVGIHIDQGVLLHGLAVNGFKTPESFQGLRPCGLDAPVDFLLPRPQHEAFCHLGERILAVFVDRFQIKIRV